MSLLKRQLEALALRRPRHVQELETGGERVRVVHGCLESAGSCSFSSFVNDGHGEVFGASSATRIRDRVAGSSRAGRPLRPWQAPCSLLTASTLLPYAHVPDRARAEAWYQDCAFWKTVETNKVAVRLTD